MRYESLADMIRRQAEQQRSRVAIITPAREWTYVEVDAASNRIAAGLAVQGVGQGGSVASLSRFGGECMLLQLAAAKLGAVAAALNWRLSAGELEYVIGRVRPSVLLTDEAMLATLAQVPSAAACAWLLTDSQDAERGFMPWLERQAATDPGFAPAPDSVAARLFSSGTTGRPKAVELTHAGILTHCQAWTERFGFKEGGTVQLNVLPTFHVSGMVYGIWMPCISGTVVYHPQFEPANYLAAIERHRVTDAFAVPAMLRALIEAPELRRTDFSSLRCIAYGGSPIDPGLLRRCMQALPCAFRQVYGMTESSGTIALLQPEDHDPDGPRAHLLQSIGKPGAHFGLRIVDPVSGRECPDGAVGELWVRSAQNLAGYFQDPDATAALFPEGRAAGWYRTGDAGYRREGYLFLHDRIKDMIITGGENVYPTEIEHVLAAHPAIMEVAVIGVPDEKWGETVKACVVVRSGRSVSPPEVIAYARERLARYKCPTSVDFLDALPRNPTGKVLKATLREPYWAGRKRNIA